jgi:two-component system CheB/CheR fusion protein
MAEQPGQGTTQELYSLVVIGASAGGIEALSTVLGALPVEFPAPIVVAQHVDPTRPSHLDAILARHSQLLVRLVTDVAPLAPGTVYVVPPDRDVEITDHEVRMRPSAGTPSKQSINRLFSSASRAYGERLIAVILTGTGSDGAAGAREVKAVGGMVVIEDPATAAFPGMPRSLAPTTVDVVAHLDQIGPLLSDLLAGTYVPRPLDPDQLEATEEGVEDDLLTELLAQLRERSGIDFSGYRRPTILRRLQRRMAATKLPRLDDYQHYLAHHPEEYQRLVSSFLIKVTEFFRDLEFFRVLRERVLPELIAQGRTQGSQLRLWSAGCATGEEAYSLAILVAEALGPELSQFTVRLFATDLDERAVAFARQAVYPAAALAGVPEELRSRYFTQLDGTYEVKKPIRALVTCGEHDLGQRAPFPRIDLVLCRNVLIYFTPEMQQHALSLFAYALRPGGYLVLGKAESAGALSDYLAPADPHLKLYRRVGETLLLPTLLRARGDLALPRMVRTHVRHAVTGSESAQQERASDWLADGGMSQLAARLPFGVVIVDRRYQVHALNSAALHLLDIYRPAVGGDLIHLAERVPRAALRRIIDAIFHASASAEASVAGADQTRPPGVTEVVTLQTGLGEHRDIEIAAYPHPPRRAGEQAAAERTETALLLVTDVTSAVQARIAAELAAARDQALPDRALRQRGAEVKQLTAQVEQVTAVNRQLVAANQEVGSANLALQQVNDELQLAQEQEQASAEEIRTLNEELQAGNEEHETVNEELEATVEELRSSNDDLATRTREVHELLDAAERRRQTSQAEAARLAAILLSLGDAVLVLDPAGTPLLTNSTYTQLFGDASDPFAAQDADGRPLPPEATPQRRAARGETFVMEFTQDREDGTRRYFEANGQPIHSKDEALGGVITIRDITERSLHRLQDEFMALASHELLTPLTPLQANLQLLDKHFADGPEHALTRDRIASALRQVRRLRRLVQDLLDVRRLQQGNFKLEIAPVPLEQVVTQSVESARMLAPVGQTIEVEIADPALVVNADAMRLEQVLMNLLINAITYAPNSPRIDVRVERAGNEAVVRVQDAGQGIPAADVPHIFARFFQSTSSNARHSQRGLGLGLYITHELVAAHGGRVEVTSSQAPGPGQGTTFTIRLPLTADEAEVGEGSGKESPGKEPKERRRTR